MTADEIQVQGSAPYKRTIAIAIDASKFSDYAFHWALEHYLRKTTTPMGINSGLDAPTDTAVSSSPQKESHDLLTKYAKLLAEREYAYKAVCIDPGFLSPKESIVREVATLNATALIVGSRDQDVLSRGFLGSVSDYCAHHCHCPVLIAKPSEEEAVKMKAHDEAYIRTFKFPPASAVMIL
ncbi:adenine nucleotide alpha hydrolases-like protein [Rhizoclosmatium globosum]|uniref:Adenine nucleotide alpha hydrolases-like protein n=1 Tax=Rhizoclosmatium globosum TaxID=329046 RepID=A0A1Y2BKD5_9FUNG|nr:adenine nucleotide alpha hydrolases-like protein [Rhizoclosmatium globosum]|eukprot:ORY35229.1 adenine nucleotide alpha hydrolases-like protein [Rhizoclosmatium globosum]